MAFNHKAYIKKFLASPGLNDAVLYGVSIAPAAPTPGQPYFRVIGVHHLTGSENGGKNNVYLDVVNEQGQRTGPPWPLVDWTWQGRKPGERAGLVVLDKPKEEPGGNIGLHAGQIATVWIPGRASDIVTGLQTAGIDDPHEEPGNHRYHHSFYVVWQRTTAGAVETPPAHTPATPPPIEAPPVDPPAATVYTHTAATFYLISADGVRIGQVISKEWAQQIVAGLRLLEVSKKDHRIESYVLRLKEWNEDNRD